MGAGSECICWDEARVGRERMKEGEWVKTRMTENVKGSIGWEELEGREEDS